MLSCWWKDITQHTGDESKRGWVHNIRSVCKRVEPRVSQCVWKAGRDWKHQSNEMKWNNWQTNMYLLLLIEFWSEHSLHQLRIRTRGHIFCQIYFMKAAGHIHQFNVGSWIQGAFCAQWLPNKNFLGKEAPIHLQIQASVKKKQKKLFPNPRGSAFP